MARGAEVSGGHQYGGYHYSFAVFDQSTSGVAQSANASAFVPSATGSANGGVGFASDTGMKNIYGRFSYRFNLERDRESRRAVQAATATGPRDHTYLSLGTFYMRGNPQQAVVGENADGSSKLLYAQAPFYRVGGDFNFNYRKLNVYGLYMYAHDDNLLPVDALGVPIPLPLGSGGPIPVGFVAHAPASFSGGFVQADYLALPWIMVIGRWDQVNSTADRINALALADSTSFFAPYASTRNRFTPGVQFLIRANLKASMEYQIRPQQSLTSVTNPVTGLQRATDPFRVNTRLVRHGVCFLTKKENLVKTQRRILAAALTVCGVAMGGNLTGKVTAGKGNSVVYRGRHRGRGRCASRQALRHGPEGTVVSAPHPDRSGGSNGRFSQQR